MINGIIAVLMQDDIVNATRIKEEKIEVIYNAVASGRSKPSKEQIEHYLKDLWKEDVKQIAFSRIFETGKRLHYIDKRF